MKIFLTDKAFHAAIDKIVLKENAAFIESTKKGQHAIAREETELFKSGFKAGYEQSKKDSITDREIREKTYDQTAVAIDFFSPVFRVVSIERVNTHNDSESTLIGYIILDTNGNPIVEEGKYSLGSWYYYISRANHNKLVLEWAETKKKK